MNPYYQDDLITLYHGDCRDILPSLEGSFFTFTDPPYNAKKDYDGWNDDMTTPDYLTFCATWIMQVKELSPELCVVVPRKWQHEYWQMLGRDYQQIILPFTPEGVIRDGFVNQFHYLLTNAKPKVRTKNVWENVPQPGMGFFFKEPKYGHPGYTSEVLTGLALTRLADLDAVILDPFGGTGTTARVAKNLGRKCVTIEYSEKWCEFIATRRLLQASMFEPNSGLEIIEQLSLGV